MVVVIEVSRAKKLYLFARLSPSITRPQSIAINSSSTSKILSIKSLQFIRSISVLLTFRMHFLAPTYLPTLEGPFIPSFPSKPKPVRKSFNPPVPSHPPLRALTENEYLLSVLMHIDDHTFPISPQPRTSLKPDPGAGYGRMILQMGGFFLKRRIAGAEHGYIVRSR